VPIPTVDRARPAVRGRPFVQCPTVGPVRELHEQPGHADRAPATT
jgi:hypothetical protein